eukprot:CAMPEP_0196575288 /NCGR_PEP_ID=MMETSP1081-20130531/4800_1 /TAXON_ID=36882 /ORGANISM="Pyramimonas amylifera, Strain CCMP720" /LENGTH=83 /DNA_ID=CAMNT_0041893543 /DNA_START=24 /DNA_END=272 /DNA_ORIENTATION=-
MKASVPESEFLSYVRGRDDANRFLLGGIKIKEPNFDTWSATIQEVGFNTISVTTYARQGIWDSAEIYFEEAWAELEELKREIR